MKNLHKQLAHYYQWRKGVLLIMPLEVLLIVVVLCLLAIALFVSYTSTKGSLALVALRNYLADLSASLKRGANVDPEVERSDMEKLLNDVKATCHQQVISGDAELKQKISGVYDQINTVAGNRTDDTKSAWLKWKAAAGGFSQSYFPASTVTTTSAGIGTPR